jgi:hypothetical protein
MSAVQAARNFRIGGPSRSAPELKWFLQAAESFNVARQVFSALRVHR